ncbi:MAG: hypothetical protein NTX49_06670 [Chlamydiae bacterium]|nr:hypothetical protein [Chlamydiota bacterium]
MTNSIDSQPLRIYTELDKIRKCTEGPVSPRTCARLFHKLDEISHSLQGLQGESAKTTSIFEQSKQEHLQDLQATIVSLYGRAIDCKVSFQVDQIAGETSHLKEALDHATPKQITKESKLLQKHVSTLLHDHRIGKEQMPVVSLAKQTLSHAEKKLKGETPEPVHHFTWMASQASAQYAQDLVDILPGEIEELFDIATLLHTGLKKEAQSRYNRLPSDIKGLVAKHLEALKETSLSEKALIATGFELAGTKEMYFSEEELTSFFQESMEFGKPEKLEPIFNMRSIG